MGKTTSGPPKKAYGVIGKRKAAGKKKAGRAYVWSAQKSVSRQCTCSAASSRRGKAIRKAVKSTGGRKRSPGRR